jgi:hypothetical protein
MGSISARSEKPRKNKQREKIPRRLAGLIAGERLKSRKSSPKAG